MNECARLDGLLGREVDEVNRERLPRGMKRALACVRRRSVVGVDEERTPPGPPKCGWWANEMES